jgi:Mlc titration factor MtfA (ptsG expression regulator)
MALLIIIFSNLLFFALLIAIGLVTTSKRREFEAFYYNRIVVNNQLSRREYFRLEKLLEENIQYFRPLSMEGKARFIQRVVRFAQKREFEGMDGFEVTEAMRFLISASAVQLTFGLSDFNLRFLETIRISSKPFYNRFFKSFMKGAVSPQGYMIISWKDFMDGYKIEDDNFNLGLHEMAHALKLDPTKSTSFDLRFSTYIKDWLKIGEEAFMALKRRTPSYLRAYGGNNHHEFFAVCVEHFFESPERFSQELPDVFNHLCLLLNQNPLNEAEDYKLTEEFKSAIAENPELKPLPQNFRKKYKSDEPNRFHYYIISGFGLSLIVAAIASNLVILDLNRAFIAGGIGAFLVGMFQLPYLVKHSALKANWRFIYGIALFAICSAAHVTINILVPVYYYKSEHNISSVYGSNGSVYMNFEDGSFSEEPDIRLVDYKSASANLAGGKAIFEFRMGCLGNAIHVNTQYISSVKEKQSE